MGKLINAISNRRLSTVAPGHVTDENTIHELQNIDLAMKLHYVNCLYIFEPIGDIDECQQFSISHLKLPMFSLLNAQFHVSGRLRGGENERPYIKCNDCGVRIVEARSSQTVEEVIRMDGDQSLFDGLVYKMVLGPDLGFSPLVICQFTWFRCGGFSVGLRWAHLLGDAFSASAFINIWASLFSNDPKAVTSIKGRIPDEARLNPHATKQLRFAKRVDPVGNHWVVNSGNMKTHMFRVGANQLNQMRSKGFGYGTEVAPFELISAILWKSVARIRGSFESRSVTVCRRNPGFEADQLVSNSQIISTVETNLSTADAEVGDLVKLISNAKIDEKGLIKEEKWDTDFIVYGANLTFVDHGEMELYEMKFKGKKPAFAVCSVDGVGEEGLVLVAPDEEDGGDGRIVTVTLNEAELAELKTDLKQTWGIA